MLTLALAAAALQPATAPAIEVRRDPMTDRVSAMAVIRSPEGRLEIGCDPTRYFGTRLTVHSTRAWFAREEFVSRSRRFQFRFDRARPVRVRWETERRTAWVDSLRTTDLMIRRAQTASRLAIRGKDVEGRRVDLSFNLAGAWPEIERVYNICRGVPVPAIPPAR